MLAQLTRVEIAELMTAEEFFAFSPDDEKAELINGVYVVSPPPLDSHEKIQGFLYALIREFAERHDLGEVRGSRTAVRLADNQVFEPDILFVAQERETIIQERGIFGAPDLVVEILSVSTARYDRGDKFMAYQSAGIQELWLIDPYGPAGTEFFQRQGNRLQPIMPDADGWLLSLALPGFRLNTTWLWPADRFIKVRTALKAMENG
ncbi:MAG TPA: Uma2 family endonuclease [Chloroflexota bacterium]|nr:Uma2 family endonuclease [Chloroflexota bacterium]